jgi:hypothetical protein
MQTKLLNIKGTWNEVLNICRATVNKPFIDKEPSDEFVKEILISEHSPIRLISIMWKWAKIPHWVGVHWIRHKWECFVATQRSDRTGVDRTKLPQDTPQDFIGEANIQHAIDTMRKRLCYLASPETRELAEDFKITVGKEYDKRVADVFVPNCVYRGGCPEGKNNCGFFDSHDFTATDIQKRYDKYNNYFDEKKHKESEE